MKRINILLGILLSLGLYSCFEDQGNYNYTEPNEVKITLQSEYTVVLGEPLHIVPEFTFQHPADSMGFAYCWEFNMDSVSHKRNLTHTFDSCKTYQGSLYLTGRKSGNVNSAFFTVKVQSPYAKGWLILSDRGESSLSFVRVEEGQKYTPFHDLFRTLHNESLGAEPIALAQHFNIEKQQIMILQKGGGGSVELDGADLHKVIRTQQEFIGEQYPRGYDPAGVYYCSAYECILNRDGRLFNRLNETGLFQSCAYSDVPFQYEGVQPVITMVIPTKGLAYYVLMFDHTKKSLTGVNSSPSNGTGKILPVLNKKDNSIFTLSPEDELIYSHAYSEGFCSSFFINVIQDKSGYRIQTYQIAVDNFDDINALLVSNPQETAFPAGYTVSDKTVFHMLRTGSRLFFSTGGVLSHYNLSTKEAKDFCDFKTITGKEVEIVDIDSNPERTELAVALSDGSFYLLGITNEAIAGGQVTILHHESGLGHIVDIMFKYTTFTHYRDDKEKNS